MADKLNYRYPGVGGESCAPHGGFRWLGAGFSWLGAGFPAACWRIGLGTSRAVLTIWSIRLAWLGLGFGLGLGLR